VIGDPAVGKPQLLPRVRLVGTPGRYSLIETDAKPRPVRRQSIALLVAGTAALEKIFPILLGAAMRNLLDAEVRG